MKYLYLLLFLSFFWSNKLYGGTPLSNVNLSIEEVKKLHALCESEKKFSHVWYSNGCDSINPDLLNINLNSELDLNFEDKTLVAPGMKIYFFFKETTKKDQKKRLFSVKYEKLKGRGAFDSWKLSDNQNLIRISQTLFYKLKKSVKFSTDTVSNRKKAFKIRKKLLDEYEEKILQDIIKEYTEHTNQENKASILLAELSKIEKKKKELVYAKQFVIDDGDRNLKKLYNLIMNNPNFLKKGKKYFKYAKKGREEKNRKIKIITLAVYFNYEKELLKLTNNPNNNKIDVNAWGWASSDRNMEFEEIFSNAMGGVNTKAEVNCYKKALKLELTGGECLIVDARKTLGDSRSLSSSKNLLFFQRDTRLLTSTFISRSDIKKDVETKKLAEKKAEEERKKQELLLAEKKKEEEKRKKELLLAQKTAEEEKKKQEILLAQKKNEEEKKKQELILAQKKSENDKKNQELLLAQKKAEDERKKQELILALKKAEEVKKKQELLVAKKRAEEEKMKEELLAKLETENKDNDNEAPIIDIAQTITVKDSSYEIQGKVTDKSDKIFIKVSGKTIEVKSGKFNIKRFSPVDEVVKIVAIDQWGNESEPKIINVIINFEDTEVAETLEPLDPSNIESIANKNRVALIIGIEKYENTPDASFANMDAKYFYEYSRKGFGIPPSNIKLLVGKEANLIRSLRTINKWLPSKVKKNETELFIYFAGHGLASADGKELYLLPQDSDPDLLKRTALSKNELFETILNLDPKSVTIFFDTCYSGVSRNEETLLASARPVRVITNEINSVPDNFTIFSASQMDQISSGIKEVKHGIFSYYLMKGLEGYADINEDKKITNGELLSYMNENVSQKAAELGREQNPSLAGDPDKVLISYR